MKIMGICRGEPWQRDRLIHHSGAAGPRGVTGEGSRCAVLKKDQESLRDAGAAASGGCRDRAKKTSLMNKKKNPSLKP